MLLDVQHISKSFTTGYIRKVKKEVLKDISFTLSKGETLGIAGTSGAGKTTLIRILMQLLVPDGGVVLYHGVDLGGLSGKEMLEARRTMQMIFQNPAAALHPRMMIRESIEEPSRLYGKMDRFEERMQEMLSRLQLRRELLSRYPAELSGGELQRVALARLLLISPEVLILDEPTSMLDVSVQAEILTLLQEFQEDQEIAYLFISHDLDVLAAMARRVVILSAGRLVEIGAAEDVLHHPQHPYTQELVRSFSAL